MRPRNLRRRVELLVPVTEQSNRAKLSRILDSYLKDPSAWVLGSDGTYTRRRAGGQSAQDQLLGRTTDPRVPGPQTLAPI
jgi:polyphosphate kinase